MGQFHAPVIDLVGVLREQDRPVDLVVLVVGVGQAHARMADSRQQIVIVGADIDPVGSQVDVRRMAVGRLVRIGKLVVGLAMQVGAVSMAYGIAVGVPRQSVFAVLAGIRRPDMTLRRDPGCPDGIPRPLGIGIGELVAAEGLGHGIIVAGTGEAFDMDGKRPAPGRRAAGECAFVVAGP